MPASISTVVSFLAKDRFSGVLKTMTLNTKKWSNSSIAAVNRFDRRITRSFNKLKSTVGSFGLILGGTALVGALSSGVSIMANYEEANSNLASVLGKTVSQTRALQIDSKRLGGTTAFSASQVAGLQTEYAKLGFSQSEILKVTESTLSLASATKTDLGQAAAQVGAALRAFGQDASQAGRFANVFAASTSKSALNMEFLNTAMSTVAPVASKFGFGVEDVTSLLGNLADSGFDASSAATATRNILLNLADSNGKLAKSLGRPVRNLPDLVKGLNSLKEKGVDLAGALSLTDKRSVAAFSTFLSGTDKINQLRTALGDAGGTAKIMADKQLNNLRGKVTLMKSAYEGFILSLDNGKGAFSQLLKDGTDTISMVLSMASGTARASGTMSKADIRIKKLADRTILLAKGVGLLTGAYIAFKVVKGIISAYTAVTELAGAAQKFWAGATWATLLPILAIIAAVIAIILVIKNWSTITKWFSGIWDKFTSWISVKWEGVVNTFKNFSFKKLFIGIGQSMIKFMLFPLRTILKTVSLLPGKLGGLASAGLGKLDAITDLSALTADVAVDSPEVTTSKQIIKQTEEIRENRISGGIDVNLSAPGQQVNDVETFGNSLINFSSTQGAS